MLTLAPTQPGNCSIPVAARSHGKTTGMLNACVVVVGLFLSIVLVLAFVAPSALRYAYPVLAFCVAIFLFSRSRVGYIQFVFWLWFISPLIRRVVDYRIGYAPTNPLLLGSFLATSVSGYILLTRIRLLSRPAALPFACALAAIFFGTVVGLTHYPFMAVAQALLNWVVPVFFAFFLYAERDRYEQFRSAIERSLLFGSLLVGAYGIYQFFALPPWDRQWMIDLDAHPFGVPEPFHLRVFSTLNSPATCAVYMMTSLILLFALKSRLRMIATPTAFLAFLLTSSRSSWIGLIFGVFYLTMQLGRKARFRLVAAIVACVILLPVATQIPVLDDVISTRFQSFTDPAHDVSYNERVVGHILAFERLLDEPMGEGMGSVDTDHQTGGADSSIGPHDSTLLESLYTLGFPGTTLYLFGIMSLFVTMLRRRSVLASQPFGISMRAIVAAFFGQLILNSIFVGPFGFILWTAIGMTLAASESSPEPPLGLLPV